MIPKLRFTYVNYRGVGEPIRLALHIGGLQFEDRRVSYEEVGHMRDSGELSFGQVPMLEIDGKPAFQSQAILRWAGRHSGLYPDDLQLECDMFEEALVDIRKGLLPQWYGSPLARHPATGEILVPLSEDQKANVQNTLNDEILPIRFAHLERLLKERGGRYFCGDRLTIADLSFYVMASGIRDGSYVPGVRANVFDHCPLLIELAARIGAHPKVLEWNQLDHE